MRRRVAMIIVALLLFPLLTGCGGGGGGGTPADDATVRGTLRDDGTLAPVAGATVAVAGKAATSNANGVFSVAAPRGPATITITAPDYEQLVVNATLSAGVNNLGTRYLRPTLLTGRGAVRGTVRNNGVTVGGARLYSGGVRATAKADGAYAMYNLEAGERAITAISPSGSATGSAVVIVRPGTTVEGIDISLALAPPDPPTF